MRFFINKYQFCVIQGVCNSVCKCFQYYYILIVIIIVYKGIILRIKMTKNIARLVVVSKCKQLYEPIMSNQIFNYKIFNLRLFYLSTKTIILIITSRKMYVKLCKGRAFILQLIFINIQMLVKQLMHSHAKMYEYKIYCD